jgi:N-methylhydantoinase A/oxoprolinase/acetone carboxylase beta subunit
VSVERGHDPRQFALVAFGGAGGMHAADIARELEIATVLVPRHAGVLSALGMLVADVTRDYSASVLLPTSRTSARDLLRRLAPLAARATADLAAEGFGRSRQVVERLLDVRYVGQSYEITIPWSADYRREFDRRHGRLYGYANPNRPTEVVAVRVRAAGLTAKPRLPARSTRPYRPRPVAVREGRFAGRIRKVAFHRWPDLEPGARGTGPVVITGPEATAVVPPGFRFRIDRFGNVVIRVQ